MYKTRYLIMCFATVVDYDALRKTTAAAFDVKVQEVKGLVEKLQKTQRAAEQTLEKYVYCSLHAACVRDRAWIFLVGMRSHAPCSLCLPRC